MTKKKSIVCFGEILWDIFPMHKVAGGAPLNVAFHANNFGMNSQIISTIGNDELGKELITFLAEKSIQMDLIHTNYTFPTGQVKVTLNEKGSASYEIMEPVAWDFLIIDTPAAHAVASADLFVFGSLACRSKNNLKILIQLIEKAQIAVFDINLRPPFFEQSVIEQLLQKVEVVKMNDEELAKIMEWYCQQANIKDQMIFIMDKFNLKTLIITTGKDGAYCINDNKIYTNKGFPIQVKDTVGSGDSFLAAFLFKMIVGCPWQECLEFACATGALVATKSGGTPSINEGAVMKFIQK